MADFLAPKSNTHATISSRFQRVQAEGRLALMPFLMAGDPDLETTAEVLLSLEQSGADMIELGIPYSDPLADGPVIQAAASRALASGSTPARVLQMLSDLRGKLSIPVILFTYTNPLFNRGMERFCDEAAEAGVAGLVVPDLPLEEAERLSPLASARGLDLVLLVAPTTPAERMARIAESSRGFYLFSKRDGSYWRTFCNGGSCSILGAATQVVRLQSCSSRIWNFWASASTAGAKLGC